MISIYPGFRPLKYGVGAFRRVVATFVFLAVATPTFSQSDTQSEIPFENSGRFGLLLIRVQANGKPALFIVDTASNQTILSSELADIHPRSLDTTVSTLKGSGFSGSGVLAKATLKVGPILWRDHPVVVMEMRALSKSFGRQIDGLLGFDFFSGFELVVIDLKNRRLILKP
jgi:predicted aspartyl protease